MYENLFTILPDESTVETILRLFGIETMSHGEMFHKELINEVTDRNITPNCQLSHQSFSIYKFM